MNRPERRQHRHWELLTKKEVHSYNFKQHCYFKENWYDYLWAWEIQPFPTKKPHIYYY